MKTGQKAQFCMLSCVLRMQEATGAPKPLVGDVSPAYTPKPKDTLSKGADKGSDKGEGHHCCVPCWLLCDSGLTASIFL